MSAINQMKQMTNGRITNLSLAALAACLAVGGCAPRFKGVESYYQATTPNPEGPYVMDPGSYGGTAYASGGTEAGTSYGTGAHDSDDGDMLHYLALEALRGPGTVDWGNGAVDSSGITVPSNKAVGETPNAEINYGDPGHQPAPAQGN